jgi:ATP-dependent helicase/nuclease subunit A
MPVDPEQTTLFGIPEPQAAEDQLFSRSVTSNDPIPEDATQRLQALDTANSLLVQAPAGAGKTSLLTQRYLALLPTVEQPEQVLAITFTRAATAEMRGRILNALEQAHASPTPTPGEPAELPLARAALRHAEARDWHLLEQPHRLDIQSIDALSLRFAHGQPLLARLGGALSPTENAFALYAAAARRTTSLLGSADPELEQALRHLLLLRDNHLPRLEQLLAAMLGSRDAWIYAIHGLPHDSASEADWAGVRAALELPFAEANARVLHQLSALFLQIPQIGSELLLLCNYAGTILSDPESKYTCPGVGPDLRSLRTLTTLPGTLPHDLEAWLCIAGLVLTKEGPWRKPSGYTVAIGIPSPTSKPTHPDAKVMKQRMQCCATGLQQAPHGNRLQALLDSLRTLPAFHYTEQQWTTLRAIFVVLRRATAELRLIFAEANTVDFVEIALAAQQVLADPGSLRGLLESEQKQHLLIDEFQDTSRTQYQLMSQLIREWFPGDGRSVFLVGDPLQSIYAFRQAEVALFHQTREYGLPCAPGTENVDRRYPCEPLQLTHNFRSHGALVDQLNQWFQAIIPAPERLSPITTEPADSFTASTAWPLTTETISAEDCLQLHPVFAENDVLTAHDARAQEAANIVAVLQPELLRMEEARRRGDKEYRIALLVSARSHLKQILPALRAAGIPYRGVALDPLGEQPEVHDLHLLLRALLHPADRIAWLTVLRASWCALTLADLHSLTGQDDSGLVKRSIPERINACLAETPPTLSPDGMARLARIWPILEDARRTRYTAENNLSLSQWLERTWLALGGPACLAYATHPHGNDNTDALFRLLDELDPSGLALAESDSPRSQLTLRLKGLYAPPDPRTSDHFGLQIMTIHKAKGLGFQTVLLAGLDCRSPNADAQLLQFTQRTRQPAPGNKDQAPTETEFLLCPVDASESSDSSSIAKWIKSLNAARAVAERKRLFYVACTRARLRLHLFAQVAIRNDEPVQPARSSLLTTAWPAVEPVLKALWIQQARKVTTSATEPPSTLQQASLQLAASAEVQVQPQMLQIPIRHDSPALGNIPTNRLDRLPAGYLAVPWAADIGTSTKYQPSAPLFDRSEGSVEARVRGTAMHLLFEQLSLLFASHPGGSRPAAWEPQLTRAATYCLRRAAYPSSGLPAMARQLVQQALHAAATAEGQWLLQPHSFAASERSWQMVDAAGLPRTVRVDRCFVSTDVLADSPGNETEYLWIIDYKSAVHAPDSTREPGTHQQWLQEQQKLYRAQLEAYATVVVADLQSTRQQVPPIRYGLYFPEIPRLLRWA